MSCNEDDGPYEAIKVPPSLKGAELRLVNGAGTVISYEDLANCFGDRELFLAGFVSQVTEVLAIMDPYQRIADLREGIRALMVDMKHGDPRTVELERLWKESA